MGSARKLEQKRLSATDWEHAALDEIAESGINGVAVEALARRLGVTKGSFYWHFSNRRALLEASLARWESEDSRVLEASMLDIDDPRARLESLFRAGSRHFRSHALFHALSHSREHELVRPYLQRVSARRLSLLTRAFRDLGMLAKSAEHRARLTYAAYAGYVQLAFTLNRSLTDPEDLEAYVQHTIDTLIP